MKKSVSVALTLSICISAALALPIFTLPSYSISALAAYVFVPEDRTERNRNLVDNRRSEAAFTPGNVVIYRVGTGSGSLGTTAAPVFLDEYTAAGALVQSIPMPTSVSGSNKRLTASGTAISEGYLTRSVDGRYLIVPGYDANVGTSSLVSSAASTNNRVIGRVDADGNVDTSTALTDAISGGNPRGAASTNGTDLWLSGNSLGGGIRYATFGSNTSTALNTTTVTDVRTTGIFDNQVYVTAQSNSIRLATVGTGTPTTSSQAITNLPGFPTGSGTPYSFFFADLSPSVAGVDTVYVADESSVPSGGGAQKYSLVSGNWVHNGTIGLAITRGLTGFASGSNVTLYATAGNATTTFQTATDTSGYNAAPNGTFSLRATAGANTAFRGVALAPVAPIAPKVSLQTSSPVNFGNQLVGTTSATVNITVQNTGTADLVLATPTFVTGTQFALVSNPNGISIAPTDTATFAITFTPTTIGSKTDTLIINSNASGPAPTLTVQGTGTAPEISITPASMTFGTQPQGSTSGTRSVTISNTGTANLNIGTLVKSGDHAADFSITANPSNSIIGPGGTAKLRVVFTPSGTGARTAKITVPSNDADEPALEVDLSGTGTAAVTPTPVKGLWVWSGTPNPVSDVTGRSNLIARASAFGITDLYVSVFQSTPDPISGRRMYPDADVAALIADAHTAGMKVWAAYGAPDWPTFGCSPTDYPRQRMQEVVDYNASRSANEDFDGVMLDVEPGAAFNLTTFADMHQCFRDVLTSDIKLGTAISAFWHAPDRASVEYPTGGETKSPVEHIIDLDLDQVVVMGYRDNAGSTGGNGIIGLDEFEIAYGSSIGKAGLVVAGLETKDLGVPAEENVTFFEEGLAVLNSESQLVADHFASSTGFGGFSIHAYQDEFASGVTGWPVAHGPATIIVNSTSDAMNGTDGFCTLREAITSANTNAASSGVAGECAAGSGADTINFDIAGGGVQTIAPASALPTITEPVEIDGLTQPGSNGSAFPPTLLIRLDGTNAPGANGLHITGGSSLIRGLIIVNFGNAGIRLETTGQNTLETNFIGVNADGATLGFNTNGVIVGSSGNVVGTDGDGIGDAAEANIIAGASGVGVFISNSGAVGNTVRGNSIFGITGLGIDLYPNGETPNDAGDGDTGANDLQNKPVITAAAAGGTPSISGTLNSIPGQSFIIDLYRNTSCSVGAEGQTYLGSVTTAATDGSGNVAFNLSTGSISPGNGITATATSGDGDTSEYSACFTASAAPTVTTEFPQFITSTGATLRGTANPNGAATTGWLRYSTANPGSCNDSFGTRAPSSGGTSLGSGTTGVMYFESVTGLSPATTYYVCAIASNSSGTSFGSVVSFSTMVPAPSVTTSAATSITATSATINGSANPNGGATIGWFRYSTVNPGTCNDSFGTRAPTGGGDDLGAGQSPVSFSEAVSGLSPATTYYFCAVASNNSGTSFGEVQSLTTNGIPDISVEDPNSNVLTDNTGTVDLGTEPVGIAGSAKTFTIRNVGSATLNVNTNVAVTGTHSAEFVVNNIGMSPTVAPSGNTAFTVTFTPSGTGPRAAQLQISSDDPDEGTFEVNLSGSGQAPPNTAPVAVDDNFSTPQNQALVLSSSDVHGNDIDPDLQTLTVTAVLNPINGTVNLVSGTITFTPTSGFIGTAGFDYTVSDGAASDTGHVTITVTPAAGAAIVVNSLADTTTADGQCTLREAVIAANTNTGGDCTPGSSSGTDTITFDTGLSAIQGKASEGVVQAIELGGTEILIASDMAINGPGADKLSIDANDASRIFRVDSGTVEISGLTITNGDGGEGSGVLISASSTVSITRCVISNNASFATGDFGTAGGGVFNSGTATITRSTLNGNSATLGGGIYNSGSITIVNSTVTGNSAVGNAILAGSGGGIYNAGGSLTATNSTISDNFVQSPFVSGPGGNVRNSSGTFFAGSTIIANGTAPSGPDFAGTLSSVGYNLIENVSGTTVTGDQTGNITGQDPQLGPLADNGGPTPTHKPAANFPGHDKGCAFGVTTDQRGFARSIDWPGVPDGSCTGLEENVGSATDIGAVELLLPTAAPATISGRVVDPNGQGLTRAAVQVFDSNGNFVGQSRTNSFGYFKIVDVPTGSSYVISVVSKLYRFEQPSFVLSVHDNVEGLMFVGTPRRS